MSEVVGRPERRARHWRTGEPIGRGEVGERVRERERKIAMCIRCIIVRGREREREDRIYR